MSATKTITRTRQNSKPEDYEGLSLDEILNKNKADRKAKEAARKTAGNKSAGGRAREPAVMLGDVAWNNLYQDEAVELTGIDFMERLEKELTKEQVQKLAEDIKKAILKKKEEFCKADFLSLQDAKTQLMTLGTEIMMEEAGFIMDEVLKDCRKQTDDLKKEKDRLNQHQYNIDVRKSKNDKLRKDADEQKKIYRNTSGRIKRSVRR